MFRSHPKDIFPERGRIKKLGACAYFFAKVDSGKDPSFKKFEGVCTQCQKGVTLKKGVRLRGAKRVKTCYTVSDLHKLYEKFENERVRNAEKLTGKSGIRPDHFVKFLAERTDFCPHALFDANTLYWHDTVSILDSEMGLNLPEGLKGTPAMFFDALSLVRSERARVRKEEEKKDK